MRIEKLGICRGKGLVYCLFGSRGLKPNHRLSICGPTHNGVTVPCSIFEMHKNAPDDDQRYFVGVFPTLGKGSCTFQIQEIDEDSHIVSAVPYRLNYFRAKWESRFNYRFNRQLCGRIRDYDEVAAFDRAEIQFWDCIVDGAEMIVRGSVLTPYRDDSEISQSCWNDELEALPVDVISLGTTKKDVPFSPDHSRREYQFSVRLPFQDRQFLFQVEDRNHPSFASFGVLDNVAIGKMVARRAKKTLNAQADPDYDEWFRKRKAKPGDVAEQSGIALPYMPKFSIIVPLYKTPGAFFEDMVRSVRNQSYGNWELILVNASPEDAHLAALVEKAGKADGRIKSIALDANLGISRNTNAGIEQATGDFVSFFDHDDTIEPDLFFSYAEAVNASPQVDVLYCDEDKLLADGRYSQPFFKPDFDLELLRNCNYICHMLTIRKSLLDQLEPNTEEFDGAQDHNLTLQAVEKAREVHHVDRALYHWRISDTSTASDPSSKPYASQAGIKAVQNHLKRLGIKGEVELGRRPFTYKVTYDVPSDRPLVSIIIPTKDHTDILDTCIRSIIEKTTYGNYEIVIIENNSTSEATFAYYEKIKAAYPDKVSVVTWEHEFNFSKLMNFGAAHSRGDYLLLLNNDTEVITPRWIDIMLGICSQPEVGIVGVKLLFPDDTIQHAGVGVSGDGTVLLGYSQPRSDCGYFALYDSQRELSAVTAACMMTKRSTFEAVGGFTEQLAVAFNDIDYCLKVRAIGQKVVYTPEVELYHYESISRGAETTVEKKVRFHREVAYLNDAWARYYIAGDPYLNSNFHPFSWYYQLDKRDDE